MCAKQVINIGTTANDGTGDPLRSAFDKVNDNFTELYTDDAGDVNSITATAPIARDSATGAVTISLNDGGISTQKIANDAVTADKLANSINSEITANTAKTGITSGQASAITANTAKVTNATHTGDVTGATALTIGDNKVITAKILNDNVTHDKLENRFTALASVSNRSGATTIDWSAAAVFVMANSLNGNIEFDFTNFKTGQTIDIYNLTGAHTITFDSNAGTSETFNKCGAVDYAGAATNLIQVQCVDDDATAVFNYAVSAYVSDATPS